MVDLELGDLLVLVGCDGDELGLLEHVRPERRVRELEDVVGPDKVKPGLVLVHRIQDGLEGENGKTEQCTIEWLRARLWEEGKKEKEDDDNDRNGK